MPSDIPGQTFLCPVTLEPATRIVGTRDYIEVDCPTCGTYRISAEVLAIETDGPEVLAFALEQAKGRARPGDVPLIDNISG